MLGRSIAARIAAIKMELKRFYRISGAAYKIDDLTVEMVKRDGKAPKMRCKGAECRGLVPFGVMCAQRMHETLGTIRSRTILSCISALMDVYMLIDCDRYPKQEGVVASRRVCIMYKALFDTSTDPLWRMKPKIHMFQELMEYVAPELGNPRKFWNYADEDFVGMVAKLTFSRGGIQTAGPTALKVLNRYRALQG